MKILLIAQWYKPLTAASANRTSKIAEFLVKNGHKVTVLTGMPSYPTGIIPPKYRRKLWYKEKIEDVNVLRTYEFPSPNKGIVKRILNNISFMISSVIGVLTLPNHKIVIISSPPFMSGVTGLFAKKLWKAKLFFDVRDLWPDSAIKLNYLKNKWLTAMLVWLEKKYYKNADKITVATPGIKEHLVSEKIPSKKIEVIINCVDTEIFKPFKVDRKKFGLLPQDFIVAYIGNLGTAQKLETTIRSAKILEKNKEIKFLYVGEGEQKENLIKLSSRLKLKNVIFWEGKSHDKIPEILNATDVTLVSLAGQNIFQEAIPSKAPEYFACAKPVIATVEGTLKEYIEKNNAGLIFKAGNSASLAEVILRLYKNPALRLKMSKNARKVAIDFFSTDRFYQQINSLF